VLLQVLGGEVPPAARGAPRLQGGEGHVEDGAAHVRVVLDVEHEHRLPVGGEHGGHALQEEGEQVRQEAFLGHVLQAHRDAVGQHVIGDDGDAERAHGHHPVETVWETDGEADGETDGETEQQLAQDGVISRF